MRLNNQPASSVAKKSVDVVLCSTNYLLFSTKCFLTFNQRGETRRDETNQSKANPNILLNVHIAIAKCYSCVLSQRRFIVAMHTKRGQSIQQSQKIVLHLHSVQLSCVFRLR